MMTQEIPEVKALIECAKRFIADETNIHELHGHAQQLKMAADMFGRNSAINNLAEEWVEMSYSYWNEWNDVEEPHSKEQFKQWLSKQLSSVIHVR